MAADGTVTDLDGKVVGKLNPDGSIVSAGAGPTDGMGGDGMGDGMGGKGPLPDGSVRLEVAELERETALLRQQSELETAFQVKLQKHGDGIRAAMQAELAMEQQNKRQGVDRNKALLDSLEARAPHACACACACACARRLRACMCGACCAVPAVRCMCGACAVHVQCMCGACAVLDLLWAHHAANPNPNTRTP